MGIQSLLVVLASLVWSLHSAQAITSSLLGGIVSIAPNAYFAYRFFASGRRGDPQKIVRAFYAGELLKLIITVVLTVAIFVFTTVLIFPFLTGLVVATLGLWSAPRVVAS